MNGYKILDKTFKVETEFYKLQDRKHAGERLVIIWKFNQTLYVFNKLF